MHEQIENLVHKVGKEGAERAVATYKDHYDDFNPTMINPMYYASGCTAAVLAKAFAEKWITPLKRKAQMAIAAAGTALALLIAAIAYSWSIMDFKTFSQFLVAFIPGVATLAFTIAKSYKTWAEAKKTLAEARHIETSAGA